MQSNPIYQRRDCELSRQAQPWHIKIVDSTSTPIAASSHDSLIFTTSLEILLSNKSGHLIQLFSDLWMCTSTEQRGCQELISHVECGNTPAEFVGSSFYYHMTVAIARRIAKALHPDAKVLLHAVETPAESEPPPPLSPSPRLIPNGKP